MMTPSMMNGALTNTFVAPMSFMIPISSLRTVIPIVIVLLIRKMDTSISMTTIPMDAYPTSDESVVMLSAVTSELLTFLTPESPCANATNSGCFDTSLSVTSYDAAFLSGLSSPNASFAACGLS